MKRFVIQLLLFVLLVNACSAVVIPVRLKSYAKTFSKAYAKSSGSAFNTSLVIASVYAHRNYVETGRFDEETTLDAVKASLYSHELWSAVYVGKNAADTLHLIDKLIASKSVTSSLTNTILSAKTNIIALGAAEIGAGLADSVFKGALDDGGDATMKDIFQTVKRRDFTLARRIGKKLMSSLNITKQSSRTLLARIFRNRVANLDFAALAVGSFTGMIAGAKLGAFIGGAIGSIGTPVGTATGAGIGSTVGGFVGMVVFGITATTFSKASIAEIRTYKLNHKAEDILATKMLFSLFKLKSNDKPDDNSAISDETIDVICHKNLRNYLELRKLVLEGRLFLYQRYAVRKKRDKRLRQLHCIQEMYEQDLLIWEKLIALSEKENLENVKIWLIRLENDSVMQKITLDSIVDGMEERYASDDEAEEEAESENDFLNTSYDMFDGINLAP